MLAWAAVCFGADAGSEDEGLRIEARLAPAAGNRKLVVFLKNLSSAPLKVFVGQRQKETDWLFTFTATVPEGKRCELWETPAAFIPGTGYREPVLLDLAPGAMHEYRFSCKQLIWYDRGGDLNSEALLRKGYAVRVSLEGKETVGHVWIGHVSSKAVRASR